MAEIVKVEVIKADEKNEEEAKAGKKGKPKAAEKTAKVATIPPT